MFLAAEDFSKVVVFQQVLADRRYEFLAAQDEAFHQSVPRVMAVRSFARKLAVSLLCIDALPAELKQNPIRVQQRQGARNHQSPLISRAGLLTNQDTKC